MASVVGTEWPGLPQGGPVIPANLKARLGLTDTADDVFVGAVAAAVNVKVRRWPVAARAADLGEWPADVTEGAMMLAARLYRRRNSASGVEAFGAEGVLYVRRNDPDIALLLELGEYAGPQVG